MNRLIGPMTGSELTIPRIHEGRVRETQAVKVLVCIFMQIG